MKKTKRIITLLSVLLMIMLILPTVVEAKQISSRSELISGPNVGNTVYLGNGRNDGTISIFKERDHLYCIQHRADTEDAWYRVDAYVDINGTKATAYTGWNGSTVKTYNSSMNTVLAYVCGEQNYYKGYNNSYTNDGVRMRAIHKYLQSWYNYVGFPKLGIARKWNDSGFSLDNHWRVKDRALKLISDGQNYANKTNTNTPTIDKNSTSKYIEEINSNTFGPFKIKYSGILESVVVKDTSGNTANVVFSTDVQGKNTVKATDIKSNTNYYIQNKSGKMLKTVSFKLKDSEVLSAKLWFLERNDGRASQRFLMTETGKSKKSGETYVMNVMPKISIRGYVWIDEQRTKLNDSDGIYNNEEHRVEGVTVNLINKSNRNVIATTKTDSNGNYGFEKVFTALQLKNYYVEFNYKGVKVSNEDISNYIPVAFNSTDINKINKAGSRALKDSIAEEDAKLSEHAIAYTYKGTEKENIYGLGYNGNLYNKLMEGEVLNNINLGLKKIPETEYNLEENLDHVDITIKGYNYRYNYGQNGDKQKVAAPRVNWQNRGVISAFSRDIYPSDIAYDIKNSTEELKVSVTYKIDITNTTNYNIEELYKEDKLVITSLTNSYDTNRYKLSENEKWTKKDGKEGTAVYKGNEFGGINKDSTVSTSITFDVRHEALIDILNHPDGTIEDLNHPTKAIAIGHHKYFRKDYSWQNDILKDQAHRTPDDPEDATAPYLIFKLGEERVLSGKVFEDGVVTTDGQILGNGVYDANENIVRDVIVELLDVQEGKNDITELDVSKLYGVEGTNPISIDAQVKTDANGNYTLKGIVPGQYFLRFTYGDGSQKIYNGNKEVNTLTAKDYKSTIITNKIVKEVLKGKENTIWYTHKSFDKNSSVAIDNLNTRLAVNEGKQQFIMAGAPKMLIRIENTEKEEVNIEVSENGEQVKLASNKFDGFNFGIIKQPRQRAKLEKVITNIKLENAQNNVGFNGNPETDALTGVSDLDSVKNGGSKYLRAELEDQYIIGSKLELTYGIRVTNISDVNYYNNDYYWYGDANPNKEVTIKINKITDYLDKTLEYIAEQSDKRIEKSSDVDEEQRTILNLILGDKEGILYTENNKARTKARKTSDTFTLVGERILSNQDDDMEYINTVEIKEDDIDKGTDPDDPDDNDKNEEVTPPEKPDPTEAVTTITPPTGADRQEIILYTIAGIIALAVLSSGVVIIKKIVKK